MKNSRLMELLRTFSPRERSRLRLFVASPYFSHGDAESLTLLLDYCLKLADTDAEPDKSEACAVVFPGEAPVAGKLEKRMSALYGLAQQFLVAEQIFSAENEVDSQIILAREFLKRGLEARARAALHTARKVLEAASTRNSVHFAKRLRLIEQEANHAILVPSKAGSVPFNPYFEALFQFYHTLRQELTVSYNALSTRYRIHLSDLARHIMNEPPAPSEILKNNPELYFRHFYSTLLDKGEPDMDNLNRYIRELREQEHLLVEEDVKICWTLARNLLVRWWNGNRDTALAKLHLELSREGAARGLLYHDGCIHPNSLETISKIALELGEVEFAGQFIREHRGRISGEPGDEPFYRLSMARYYLLSGDPIKALEALPQSISDQSFQLNVKILEIQILYDLDSELLPYRMDALRVFLGRSTNRPYPAKRLKASRVFLNLLARICRCPPGAMRRAEKIADSIRSWPHVMEYRWLLKKAQSKAKPQFR